MNIFNKTKIPLLSKALDAYSLRQKTTAMNIANITTEGYQSKSVKFEDELNSAMAKNSSNEGCTHKNHIPINSTGGAEAHPKVDENASQTNGETDLKSGINDVDIDHEMAELAKNQIRFKFAARMIADNFKGIQKSIKGYS